MNTIRNDMRQREHGMVAVMAALSLVILAGVSAFAVDYGLLQYKKSELQTAADTASLAGAQALVSSGTDLDIVRATALEYAKRNLQDMDFPDQAVTTGDISFYKDGVQSLDKPNQVEVVVGLEASRGNPYELILGKVVGKNQADVRAAARSETFCSNGSQCLKPFSPPAKFTWDDNADTDKKYAGNGMFDPESAPEVASVVVQGYQEADIGTLVHLKLASVKDAIVPSNYYAIDYPALNKGNPVSGADMYRTNIAGCDGSNRTVVEENDEIVVEPGNMVGPTEQGVSDLIALDPGAYWDLATQSIKGSAYPDPISSPRVAIIPFFDPSNPPNSGRNSIFVYQLGAVFVEGTGQQGEVIGRFVKGLAVSPRRDANVNDCLLAGVSLSLDSKRGAKLTP
ncbi:pilus assembly protein TadG-related protein [Desulfovibrio inopinatus]|uniref:pilus assembly protein TadG-related protein n=1 Tax=Desulfovibrio inopinatus TaxID=102109 RepID=UPI00068550A6|nr:TadE/TadG family type IV pilus assembly protein [Desulfovibrio inopinatus]